MNIPEIQNLSRETRLLMAVSAAQVAGLMGPSLFPFMLGLGIDVRHMTFASSGTVITTVLLSRGVGAILAATLINFFSKKTLLFTGAIMAIAAYVVSDVCPNNLLMLPATVGGLGAGMILGISYALMAESETPTRLCGQVLVIAGLMLSFLSILCPKVLLVIDHKIGILMATVTLSALPLMLLAPAPKSASPAPQDSASPAVSIGVSVSAVFVVFLIAGYCLDFLGEQMLWTFVQKRGQVVGFSDTQVGLVLGITAMVGLLGAILASLIGSRFGQTLPLALGLALTAAGMWSVMYFSSKGSFIGWRSAWTFGSNFYGPFFVGAMASIDPRGRLNSLAAGLAALAGALGPTAGGWIIQLTGYARDATILSVLIKCLIIGLVLPATLTLDRKLRPAKISGVK